ncbi:MAG: hypothetical protein KKD59_07670 [Acidobacteria bacterium]|nr:hypothetical protein [Acidobacteriota bacterium]
MTKRFLGICTLILILGGSTPVSAQTAEPQYTYRWLIQPALQIDHFSRSVKAEGEDDINRIKSTLISVNLGFEIREDFILGLTVGYSFNRSTPATNAPMSPTSSSREMGRRRNVMALKLLKL